MRHGEGPRATTVILLAFKGGRADRLRIALTAVSASLAASLLLGAANVVLIDNQGFDRYTNPVLDEQGLHQGVLISIVGLLVPLMLFVAQCSRLGAPARDRRLAGFRMSGASPRTVRAIASSETGLAALGGAAVGAIVFALVRLLLGTTLDVQGRLRFPTDVAIPLWIYAIVISAIPTLAAAGALLALRRVRINPLGVIRRSRSNAPAAGPFLLLCIGVTGLAFADVVFRVGGAEPGTGAQIAIALAFFVCVSIGLTLGSAGLAERTARLLPAHTRSPALLIAARRTLDAPFRSSRPTAAVLVTVFIAAAIQQTRVTFLLTTDPTDTFYASTFDLLNLVLGGAVILSAAGLIVAGAESIVERRRDLAVLVANGTPRRTLAAASILETTLPLIPGIAIATAAGTLVSRGFFGTEVTSYAKGPTSGGEVLSVGVPWDRLLAIGVGSLTTVIAMAALALLFLPAATSPTELRTAA